MLPMLATVTRVCEVKQTMEGHENQFNSHACNMHSTPIFVTVGVLGPIKKLALLHTTFTYILLFRFCTFISVTKNMIPLFPTRGKKYL